MSPDVLLGLADNRISEEVRLILMRADITTRLQTTCPTTAGDA